MSYFKTEFYSNCLSRFVSLDIFIPNDFPWGKPEQKYLDRGMGCMFMLHGWTGSAGRWSIEDLARRYNFAIVSPNGENSFYLDTPVTGHKYCSYVGSELVEFVRDTFGIAKNRELTAVCGLSMGGFGALHTGAAFPENFGYIGAMSSAFIVDQVSKMKPGCDEGLANYEYYRYFFGDPEKVLESDADPRVLFRRIKAQNKEMPKIYVCCGTEDFLIEENRSLNKFFTEENIEHIYLEGPGSHDNIFWDDYSRRIAEWIFG